MQKVVIPKIILPDDPEDYDSRLAEEMLSALKRAGHIFVYAPEVQARMSQIYAAILGFYKLPEKEKRRYMREKLLYERGYMPGGVEHGIQCQRVPSGSVTKKVPDQKQSYMIGPEDEDLPTDPKLLEKYEYLNTKNIWPCGVDGFREANTWIYAKLRQIGSKVLRVLERPLELPEGYFEEMTRHGPTVMRSIFYPTMEHLPPSEQVWACEHTDINLITVLPKSTCPGLQIYVRETKEWVSIAAPEGFVTVQVGDILHWHLPGKVRSTMHKVEPVGDPATATRQSIALFMHARSDYVIMREKTSGDLVSKRLRKIELGKPPPA